MSTPTITKRRKVDSVNESRPRRSSIIPKSTNTKNADGISNCFHRVKSSLYVSLAPLYIQDPIAGVKSQHLDPLIMTYFPQSKGIVLGYFNISFSEDSHSTDSEGNAITVAKVTNDTPFLFLWVNVEFLVWRPQVGDVVEGWIYMQTQSHIGLLIHDTFNATIKKFNIPSTWEFVPNQVDEIDAAGLEDDEGNNNGGDSGNSSNNKVKSLGVWRDENGVIVDGKIRFTIKAVHTAGRVVSVEGTLVEPGTETDSLPVTVSKQHKKFAEDDNTVVSVTLLNKVEDNNERELEIPQYTANSDDEVVAEEDSSDESDSD